MKPSATKSVPALETLYSTEGTGGRRPKRDQTRSATEQGGQFISGGWSRRSLPRLYVRLLVEQSPRQARSVCLMGVRLSPLRPILALRMSLRCDLLQYG